jgi:hypothetical protein
VELLSTEKASSFHLLASCGLLIQSVSVWRHPAQLTYTTHKCIRQWEERERALIQTGWRPLPPTRRRTSFDAIKRVLPTHTDAEK